MLWFLVGFIKVYLGSRGWGYVAMVEREEDSFVVLHMPAI